MLQSVEAPSRKGRGTEFIPGPSGGRRESTRESCILIFICTHKYVCPHLHKHITHTHTLLQNFMTFKMCMSWITRQISIKPNDCYFLIFCDSPLQALLMCLSALGSRKQIQQKRGPHILFFCIYST